MGIDWGRGLTNVDLSTGIRYGVIPANDLGAAWWDNAEADYGPASCPKCGCEAIPYDQAEEESREDDRVDDDQEILKPAAYCSCDDYGCPSCRVYFGSDEAYGEEAQAWSYGIGEDGERIAGEDVAARQSGDDCDIFVLSSDYFTFAPYCSPCAPGACYLRDAGEDGDDRAYCFGHDWFWDTERGYAPYPVYSVETGEEIYPPALSF